MDLAEIIKKYDLNLLLVFGSYNTERFTADSDIDVGFLSKADLNLDQEMNLLEDLVRFFKRDQVDLVNLKKAVPLLMYEIACNSRVFYDEDNNYLKFKIKASARYADTKFLRDARRKYLEEQIGP
jgi:predicted nucleotidyltransferase